MSPTPNARCLNCNYPLHSLPTNTCPECGQQFNPANPATMNLGKTPGPLARKLLTHTGLPTLLLALAASITLFIISGPPRFVTPNLADTLYYLNQRHSQSQTLGEKTYIAALLLWILILAFYSLRIVLRLICQRLYKLQISPKNRPVLRRLLFATGLLFSIAVVLYSWPLRVARSWVALSKPPPTALLFSPTGINFNPCPFHISQSEQITALQIASTSRFQTRRTASPL